jgi:hypothetical protein
MRYSPRLSALKFLFAAAFMLPAVSFAQPDPTAQAGRLSALFGDVSIQVAGVDDWGQAQANLPLGPGDRIFTSANGRAEIQIGRSFVRVGANSDVTVVQSTPEVIAIGVAQGSVHLHTLDLWPGQVLQINTPSGSATLDRPGELRLDVFPGEPSAIFDVIGGQIQVNGAGGFFQELGGSQTLQLSGINPVYPQWLDASAPDELDHWSHGRDAQILHAQSYRYMSPEIAGGEELDANGIWLPGTDYGAIWFPNNVAPDWTPYHQGHWINRQPWGSVWVEDEPWGYAPFHYGRWVKFSGRWGWVPGPPAEHPVWSPALVAFAAGFHAGGAEVSAWFPLGPGEPYRPWYHCSPRYIDQVNITNIAPAPRVHVERTYVNVNVVNVTYVNQGIAVSAMRHEDFAAGRPVHQAAINIHDVVNIHIDEHPHPPAPEVHMFMPPPPHQMPLPMARPMLMNAQGRQFTAAPGEEHHEHEPPMQRFAPVAQPPAGHMVVAPPPNAAPFHPAQMNNNVRPQPVPNNPPARPAPSNGNQPANQPAQFREPEPVNSNRQAQPQPDRWQNQAPPQQQPFAAPRQPQAPASQAVPQHQPQPQAPVAPPVAPQRQNQNQNQQRDQFNENFGRPQPQPGQRQNQSPQPQPQQPPAAAPRQPQPQVPAPQAAPPRPAPQNSAPHPPANAPQNAQRPANQQNHPQPNPPADNKKDDKDKDKKN